MIAYVIALLEPSASEVEAVRPTVAPFAAFSATVFASLLESAGAAASNSSTSVTEIVTSCVTVLAFVPSETEIVNVCDVADS